jgi:hypothetical protein
MKEVWVDVISTVRVIKQKRKNTPKPPPTFRVAYPPACVYIVQLLTRTNTFKIGCSTRTPARLAALQTTYGRIRPILLLPCEEPRLLEKALHQRFTHLRIYDEGSASELFQITTQREKQRFEQFILLHDMHRFGVIKWGMFARKRPQEVDTAQKMLFAI